MRIGQLTKLILGGYRWWLLYVIIPSPVVRIHHPIKHQYPTMFPLATWLSRWQILRPVRTYGSPGWGQRDISNQHQPTATSPGYPKGQSRAPVLHTSPNRTGDIFPRLIYQLIVDVPPGAVCIILIYFDGMTKHGMTGMTKLYIMDGFNTIGHSSSCAVTKLQKKWFKHPAWPGKINIDIFPAQVQHSQILTHTGWLLHSATFSFKHFPQHQGVLLLKIRLHPYTVTPHSLKWFNVRNNIKAKDLTTLN